MIRKLSELFLSAAAFLAVQSSSALAQNTPPPAPPPFAPPFPPISVPGSIEVSEVTQTQFPSVWIALVMFGLAAGMSFTFVWVLLAKRIELSALISVFCLSSNLVLLILNLAVVSLI